MTGNKKLIINYLFFLVTTAIIPACTKEITYTKKAKPEVVLSGGDARLLADNIHLVKDTVYILSAFISRNAGQTLTIDAGTLIKVSNKVGIQIYPGGQLQANGTQSDPVVFTSASLKGQPGKISYNFVDNENFWYGIYISGATGKSSGSISYTRIEFAGGRIGTLPGEASLALYNVDSLTTINHVQVSYSYDRSIPSFNFYGGNVNASNLVSYTSVGSDLVLDEGYKGRLQNVLVYRHPYFSANCDGQSGCPGDLGGVVINGTNTFPAISNLTVIGPPSRLQGTRNKYFDTVSATGGSRVAALIVRGGKFHIRNSVFSGFPKTGFYLDDRNAARALNIDESEFSSSVVQTADTSREFFITPRVYFNVTSAEFKGFMLRSVYKNQVYDNFESLQFTDPYNYDVKPDPLPKAGSPLLSGASFDGGNIFNNSFFKPVQYRGAFGAENWMDGWVNFLPLQTDYNN